MQSRYLRYLHDKLMISTKNANDINMVCHSAKTLFYVDYPWSPVFRAMLYWLVYNGPSSSKQLKINDSTIWLRR